MAERLPVIVRAAETVEGHGRLYQARRARDSAARELRAATSDRIARLTGSEMRAEAIAARAGIGDVSAEVPPEGKVAEVEGRRRRGGHVAFAGDGLNDAPAIAAADALIRAAFVATSERNCSKICRSIASIFSAAAMAPTRLPPLRNRSASF